MANTSKIRIGLDTTFPSIPHPFTAADDTVARAEALALLRSWFLASPQPGGSNAPATHTGVILAAENSPLAAINGSAENAGSALWQNDAAFMRWAEGAGGAARLAMELKALRTRAAARAVQELCSSTEGTDGLVKGLQEALQDNPSLLLQLRSLLK
jgi:hypothetical protein